MLTKKDVKKIIELLKCEYPISECSLKYSDAWQLLVAVRLSAQCTDARVNIVVTELFAKYPTLQSLSKASASEIEAIVRPCGLGKSKARDINLTANMLIDSFNCNVPDNMNDLLKLPGVGRKSANLIMGDIYKKPAVVTDTHCIRIANRLGIVSSDVPFTVEKALWKVLLPEESSDFCHRCVMHGRVVCTARKAYCEKCCLNKICKTGKKSIEV